MASKPRPQMTSVDYVVIALSPLLITVLVGSLCFFLLEVGYSGKFSGRMNWIMFWFVIATVGIARISMEEGTERASVYGLGLCGAVGVAMLRFVDSPVVAWLLMIIVWWCAHKLTWDCTLIDDEQDASGEGLLQIAGFDEGPDAGGTTTAGQADKANDTKFEPAASAEGADKKRGSEERVGFWERLLNKQDERRKRPHAPGLWVVYFSLAALPLFGLGQAAVPAGDIGRRRYVFWLLVAYVASAMGLLLTTSFLGLRRYLRQRKLEMPLTMTGTWLGVGAVLIVAVLTVAMLAPRPRPEYPVEQLIANALKSPEREASRWAVMRDSAVKEGDQHSGVGGQGGEKQSAGSQQGQGQQGQNRGQDSGVGGQGGEKQSDGSQQGQGQQGQGQQGQGQQGQGQQGQGQQGQSRGQDSGVGGQGGEKQPAGSQTEQRQQEVGHAQKPSEQDASNEKDGERAGADGRKQSSGGGTPDAQKQDAKKEDDAEQQSKKQEAHKEEAKNQSATGQGSGNPQAPPTPPKPSSPSFSLPRLELADWIRWLLYALMLAAAVVGFLRYREQVLDFLRRLWAEFKSLLNDLFGRKRDETFETIAEAAPPPRPFAAFRNPFANGAAERSSSDQLVRYTFEALEAWAYEQGVPRRIDETPNEFAQHLGGQFGELAADARQVASLYAQITYARATLSRECLPALERLWRQLMTTQSREIVVAATD